MAPLEGRPAIDRPACRDRVRRDALDAELRVADLRDGIQPRREDRAPRGLAAACGRSSEGMRRMDIETERRLLEIGGDVQSRAETVVAAPGRRRCHEPGPRPRSAAAGRGSTEAALAHGDRVVARAHASRARRTWRAMRRRPPPLALDVTDRSAVFAAHRQRLDAARRRGQQRQPDLGDAEESLRHICAQLDNDLRRAPRASQAGAAGASSARAIAQIPASARWPRFRLLARQRGQVGAAGHEPGAGGRGRGRFGVKLDDRRSPGRLLDRPLRAHGPGGAVEAYAPLRAEPGRAGPRGWWTAIRRPAAEACASRRERRLSAAAAAGKRRLRPRPRCRAAGMETWAGLGRRSAAPRSARSPCRPEELVAPPALRTGAAFACAVPGAFVVQSGWPGIGGVFVP